MQMPSYPIPTGLLLICLALDLAFWGGVAGSRTLSPVLREPLRMQAPLAYSYLLAGETVGSALGMTESLAGFAESNVDTPEQVLADPVLAVDRLMAARSGWLKPLHPAPLLLAPVALVLWWRRPRPFKTFGGRR
jgi:hypothetical protein